MDVFTFDTVTVHNPKVHKIPLEAQGPIGKGLSTLLIGRSSATMQGIFVYPGCYWLKLYWTNICYGFYPHSTRDYP